LMRDPVTHRSTCSCAGHKWAWPASESTGWSDRFSQVVVKMQRTPARKGPRRGRSALVCFSVGWLARTPSITAGTKEEQQIRVMTEFGIERGRTRVEEEVIRVEVLICFNWFGCPQSTVTPCIYRVVRSCPSRSCQIYLWKFKSDQICSYRSDRCESI
jgi:hypothetical protein